MRQRERDFRDEIWVIKLVCKVNCLKFEERTVSKWSWAGKIKSWSPGWISLSLCFSTTPHWWSQDSNHLVKKDRRGKRALLCEMRKACLCLKLDHNPWGNLFNFLSSSVPFLTLILSPASSHFLDSNLISFKSFSFFWRIELVICQSKCGTNNTV